MSLEASEINVKHFAMPMRPEVKRRAGHPADRPRSRSVRPTVAEIDKGIPEVIEQWRDTFGN